MKALTKKEYQNYLDEYSPDYDSEEWIIGGKNRAEAFYPNYGAAVRKHDPIAFESGYQEAAREEEFRNRIVAGPYPKG